MSELKKKAMYGGSRGFGCGGGGEGCGYLDCCCGGGDRSGGCGNGGCWLWW